MKKLLVVMMLVFALGILVACSSDDNTESSNANNEQTSDAGNSNSGNNEQPSDDPGTTDGEQYEEATITMLTTSHATWPYREDWPMWTWIKDAINIELEVDAIDDGAYGEALSLAVASGTLGDITFAYLNDAVNYGQQGALLDLNEHMDELPNLNH